ncbi:MAG: hypothetical protein GY761_02375 [Hyphomicrobiales bacterium]|nr:hypothetical protein [Hyphomicrobiales bacterium]
MADRAKPGKTVFECYLMCFIIVGQVGITMALSSQIDNSAIAKNEIPKIFTSSLLLTIIFGLLVSATIIGVSIAFAPADRPFFHFGEDGIVTAFSSVFLAMSGALAMVVFYLRRHDGLIPGLFWFCTMSALIFLSLDELLKFHERGGQLLQDEVINVYHLFRSWDDLIVIVYGVVAVVAAFIFRREITHNRSFTALLTMGFGFYILHTAIDSLISRSYLWKDIPEEGAKVTCGLFILLAVGTFLVTHLKTLLDSSDHPVSKHNQTE